MKLPCVGNKTEISVHLKNAVETFSAYVHKVIFKKLPVFNFFYLCFCLGPKFA